jgi:uncharacterized protein YbcV (DUF1398 family)
MFDIRMRGTKGRVLNVSVKRVAGVRTVTRASHVKTCEKRAAGLPKSFAAFYQNYARAEILFACYHSLLESQPGG